MADPPALDGRRRDDLFRHAADIAPSYTDEWDPEADDAGTALLWVFAELGEEVTERLDRVPEKHRVAFYDTLGFSRRPPQAARLPLSVAVAESVGENVPIPAGTQAVGGEPELTFEIPPDGGFEATPARPVAAYSVAPGANQIYGHDDLLDGGEARLFGEPGGLQEHALYVGHAGQLAVEGTPDAPTTVRVAVETDRTATELATRFVWEFYGDRDGEAGWHEVTASASSTPEPVDGGTDEALLVAVVASLAEVIKRIHESLAAATVEELVAALVEVLERVRGLLGDPGVRNSVDVVERTLGRLSGQLEEGATGDAAREELEPAVERLVENLEAAAVEAAVREDLEPAIGRLLEELNDGPVGEAVRTDLVSSIEGLYAAFSDELAPLEAELERLGEGEGGGEIIRPVETILEERRDVVSVERGRDRAERRRDAGTPLEGVIRALTEVVARLHEALDPEIATAVIEGLIAVVRALVGELDERTYEESLEAIASAVEELSEGVTEAALEGPTRAAFETLESLATELGGGSVGDALREELLPALERLAEHLEGDEAVQEFVDALLELLAVIEAEPVGPALRDDLAGALGRLVDSVGDTPLGEPLQWLLDVLERLYEWLLDRGIRVTDPKGTLRWAYAALAGERDDEAPIATREVDLAVDGSPAETTVGGVESLWLRCRVPESEWGSELFETHIGTDGSTAYEPPVSVGPVAAGTVAIDTLLATETELSVDEDVLYPLGRTPRQQDAFYVGSTAAFTKAGATVAVEFEDSSTDESSTHVDADVAWEYWDGGAWSRLGLLASTEEQTKNLRTPGSVRFRVPNDLEETSVAGHDGHWVRARLVDGDYGRFEATEDSGTWTTTEVVDPPAFEGVTVRYTGEGVLQSASHLVARNNLAYGPDLIASERIPFVPFVGLPDDEQALYLGFDRPLDDGPITLLFDLDEIQYAEGFHPRLRWERATSGGWTRLNVRDGTESFTERGIVSLTFADPTRPTIRFGEERHWIRARVAGEPFTDAPPDESIDSGGADRGGPEPCGEVISTEPPAGEPGHERPTVTGLYPNTVWAFNVRTVEEELLGSSDGTQEQTFAAANPPATDVELWVDEVGGLSAGQREQLRDDPAHAVEAEPDPDGELGAFWVRWTAVDSLLDSDGDDRHYTLDRATGRVTFGDGNRGRIPPRGRDNVRASYRTGGGIEGNVPGGTIEELKSSIPFVDGVTNPLPADGGAGEESVGDVLERAPKELRDRGRAVTAADVERIALDASRRLARARCFPAMDREGGHAPGWVTLLVVPASSDDRPVPSVTLREDVRTAVSERAAATLVADPEQLVVRGPSYVSVSVETAVVADGAGSLSRLEEDILDAIDGFLHPLSGGPDGDGWAFGEPPCHSDFYALLERLDGVDHVEELVVRFEGSGSPVAVHEGDPDPGMSSDALIHNGSHDVRAIRPLGGS